MFQSRFLMYALRVILVIAAILFGIVVLAWKIVTFPFKFIRKGIEKRVEKRFFRDNAPKKFLFYTSSNYKMVERYLLPLLDDSFTIHFIDQGNIDAWEGHPFLKDILNNDALYGGYPYFIKLNEDSTFWHLSFRRELTRLKNGTITRTYVHSVIYFFFQGH